MASHAVAVLRIISAILIAGWLAPVLTAGLAGLGVPTVLAGASAVVVAAAATAWAVWVRRGVDWILDVFLAGPRIWLVIMLAAAGAACVWNARLTVFMIDSSRVNCSYEPGDPFLRGHSCFSAYAEAARFAEAGDVNIYEPKLYAPETTAGPRRMIGGNLRVDVYHYPPPFLLLPGAIRLAAPEFAATRAVWFMVQSLLLAAALVMISRWIGGVPGAWAAASGWLVLASPAVLSTLQAGNFQVTVYSLAIIAFVLVTTGRELSGAAILAYATAGKIVPGVLVLFLLTARRWRAVAYTAAFSLLLCAITVAWFGWTPMRDFIWYEMPKLASGEAFPQAERLSTSLANLSVYGETVRLRRLLAAWFGVNWLGPEVGRPIASVYGIIVVLLTAGAGWLVGKRGWLARGTGPARGTRPRDEAASLSPETRIKLAQMVLALLSLTAFRSPFVGSIYGYLGTMWLLTLLAAEASTAMKRAGWLAGFGIVAAAMLFTPSPVPQQTLIPPPQAWMVVTSVMFSSVLLLNLGVVARTMAMAWRHEAEAPPLGAAVAARAALAAGISGGPAGGRPGL
jgi:alpha-1,2-mannosyltransferase